VSWGVQVFGAVDTWQSVAGMLPEAAEKTLTIGRKKIVYGYGFVNSCCSPLKLLPRLGSAPYVIIDHANWSLLPRARAAGFISSSWRLRTPESPHIRGGAGCPLDDSHQRS
jgi:hypothetical protein